MNNEDELLVELLDEDGNPTLFEHVTTVLYEEKEYLVLQPLTDEDEEDTVVILRIIPGKDEDAYVPVEDDDELMAVYTLYAEEEDDE